MWIPQKCWYRNSLENKHTQINIHRSQCDWQAYLFSWVCGLLLSCLEHASHINKVTASWAVAFLDAFLFQFEIYVISLHQLWSRMWLEKNSSNWRLRLHYGVGMLVTYPLYHNSSYKTDDFLKKREHCWSRGSKWRCMISVQRYGSTLGFFFIICSSLIVPDSSVHDSAKIEGIVNERRR